MDVIIRNVRYMEIKADAVINTNLNFALEFKIIESSFYIFGETENANNQS